MLSKAERKLPAAFSTCQEHIFRTRKAGQGNFIFPYFLLCFGAEPGAEHDLMQSVLLGM